MLPANFLKDIQEMSRVASTRHRDNEYSEYMKHIQMRLSTSALAGGKNITLDFSFEENAKRAAEELTNAGFKVTYLPKDKHYLQVSW